MIEKTGLPEKVDDLSTEQLKEKMDAKKQADVKACDEAITEICLKFNCELIGIPVITPQGTIGVNIGIRSKS